MTDRAQSNPFAVFTPEGLDAARVIQIFSTAVPGLGNLKQPGHSILVGTRGSGKSIAFRYLEPDCQMLVTGEPIPKLPHFALYVSLRETEAQISELDRLQDKHGEVYFNEHLLVLSIAARVTTRLIRNGLTTETTLSATARGLYDDMDEVLPDRGAQAADTHLSAYQALTSLSRRIQRGYRASIQYVKRHAFRTDILPYDGYLYGFEDFLLPYVRLLRLIFEVGDAAPTYLLLDDADSLTFTQTKIVNTWIARRLSNECSLKVAAQLTLYKTSLTTFCGRIESPHDYHEINISDVNSKSSELSYRSRIATIISQRLSTTGVTQWADKFFPEDGKQRAEIDRLAERLRAEWKGGGGRGFRARDDVQRYARPEYIRQLGGTRKSRSSYSYSGFDQLVHISSGVPRFFLEAAADMYDRATTTSSKVVAEIGAIPPDIQNDVIREHAERQFIWDIRDLRRDVEKLYGKPQRAVRLHNLINGIGSLFEAALLDSEASERKYFSFAFSDVPDDEVEDVLELGLRYGYFFRRVIGRKEGLGRTSLYILSRRLAPLFNLDPNGVAAYKFMTNAAIRELMDDPDRARKMLRKNRFSAQSEDGQSLLPFDDSEV